MFIEETLKTEITRRCDVLVVGGGYAGIAAAAAAARMGKQVILAERMFLLGGLGTAGLVNLYLPICDGCGRQVSFGLAEELLKLSVEHQAYHTRGYDNWVLGQGERNEQTPRYAVDFNPGLAAISYEQFLLKSGVKILYGTYAVAASVEEGKITAVIMENKSGRFGIQAKSYVDGSGDGDLAKFSGAPTALYAPGNKLAAWYYYGDNCTDSRVMLGCADTVDGDGTEVAQLTARRFAGLDGDEISEFVTLSHASTLRDIQNKRREKPETEPNAIASMPQLRMTRRICGEYTLDIDEQHTYMADSVGMVGNWRKRGPVYEVPFGTLYSKAVKNLIFAGRCVSVTDDMWDILRVIPCCSVTGQAAGTAAAMTDDFSALDVAALQKALQKQGVVLHEQDL